MSQIQAYTIAGGGGSTVTTLTGNTGGAVGPTAGNINVVGSGSVAVAGNPGTSTLTITVSGGGLAWQDVVTATVALAANNGYIMNRGTLITATLPATIFEGQIIDIVGKGAGGWLIAQNAGQTIHYGTQNTTTGATGSLASVAQYDCVTLICTTTNTDFVVKSSIGNLAVT